MDIKQALEVIEEVAADLGEPMLETLIYMQANLDDFPEYEVKAFRICMRDFQKLFSVEA